MADLNYTKPLVDIHEQAFLLACSLQEITMSAKLKNIQTLRCRHCKQDVKVKNFLIVDGEIDNICKTCRNNVNHGLYNTLVKFDFPLLKPKLTGEQMDIQESLKLLKQGSGHGSVRVSYVAMP